MKKIILFLAIIGISIASYANKTSSEEKATIELDKKAFIEKVFDYNQSEEWSYKGNKPAIIDFWAAWCGPCRQIAPVLEELAKEYGDEIVVYKVNVDQETELAQTFGIRSIPTLLFVPMEGIPQAIMGSAPKSKLKNAVETILLNKEEK